MNFISAEDRATLHGNKLVKAVHASSVPGIALRLITNFFFCHIAPLNRSADWPDASHKVLDASNPSHRLYVGLRLVVAQRPESTASQRLC